MNAVKIIARKRDGHELSDEEITWWVRRYAEGELPDYQMAAWAMAVYLQGMTDAETASLTRQMLDSGRVLAWDDDRPMVDKHSTGGLGDKTSIPLAPLLACCDLCVPMLSGRGLGITGGTLDKLEAIPGFRTDLSMDELQRQVRDIGCCITGASPELAPADRQLYALRDVTATVPSIPLITASIMSKKLAEGLNCLVLDVKHGAAAFMKTTAAARQLASSLMATGRRMGVDTEARLTDMNQPLGRMVGNAVEIRESLDLLEGHGPPDLLEVTLELGASLLCQAGRMHEPAAARQLLQRHIDTGAGRDQLAKMVAAQGGDLESLSPAGRTEVRCVQQPGFVTGFDGEALGYAVIALGGGRRVLTDTINHRAGLEMLVRLGDPVERHQPWCQLHTDGCSPAELDEARRLLDQALIVSATRSKPPILIESVDTD